MSEYGGLAGLGQRYDGPIEVSKRLEPLTERQILTEKKKIMEAHLAHVNAALKALDEHPEIEKVLTLVSLAVRG